VVNIHITNLPSSLFYYIADELLGLPRTEDWLNEAAIDDTQFVYNHFARLAKGDLPERVENQPPSHQLSGYTGEYTHHVYGSITIILDDDSSLFMKMSVYEHKLEHYHFESFTTLLHDFNVKFGLLFSFGTDISGKVDTIKTVMEGIPLEFKRK
jgi:hypothetical protein